ncbi:MAG: DUF2089 family protein [Verrucomicrobiaceae bacterium]|jgi:hypothetical protein|nr:DUF2089 family protein [Verrucomicrobiaceae bacterium]
MKRLPVSCPSCERRLDVKRLVCGECGTEVEGVYPLPPLAALGLEDQAFICDFVKASGSLKEMAALLKVSYPTVRNRLDEVIGRLRSPETESEAGRGEG